MTFVFKPAVYKSSTLTLLPKPIKRLKLPFRWDMEKHKVPLEDGETTQGHSLNGVSILVAGEMGSQAGTPKISEEDMFTTLEALKVVFDVSVDADKFEFFVYHDAGTSTYRKFKTCVCNEFAIDIGDEDRVIFPWVASIFCGDPVIYTTAPGA